MAESKLTQSSFAALHEREALRCHFRAVGQARCEASGGRAIPRRQTSAPRERANLHFAEPSIESVIGVHAVSNGGESAGARQIVQRGEQLVFAEIAAVCRVSAVSRVFHFMRFDEFVPRAQLAHKSFDDGAIVRGKTG